MGDRQPPFSMVPPNYPPGAQAAAQQRIYQFQAQQYLARRQQQQQQQQQQGGMELLGGQGAHQTDFARNNSLAHMGLGGQAQPPGAIGANFGVPRPDQVNGANNQGQPAQQPQPPQQHPGLASFGGAGGFVFPPPGGPNGTAGLQNAMAAHVQNPALMQQMAHAGGLAVAGAGIPGGAPGVGGGAGADQMRQLNMIGAARQQLPQQGLPGRLAAAGVAQQMALQQFQQAGAGANGPPGTNPMFPGGHPANGLEGHMAGMGQLGGHLGQQAGAGMMNPMGGVPGNPSIARPSMEQLKQFMQTTRNDMKMLETELAALPSTRGERSEAEINARAATLRNQLLQKRAHLGKIVNFIQATHGRGALGGQPGASDTTASPRMQPQGSTPAPTNGAWIGSPALNPTGTPFQGHAHLSPAMGAMAPQPGQNAPGSGMQPGPLDSNAMLLRPPSRPVSGMNPAIASAPRLGGTMPLGMPGRLGMIPGVGGEQVTQGAQAQHPGAMAGLPGQQMTVPPLERSKFLASFGSYLKSRNQTLDQRLIGDRQIDPYQLHVEVMKAGGFAVVEQNDLWPVIGGKLGIVQFPANSSDPAKSAPAAANAIAHLYKEYFAGFEEIYRLSLNQARPGATHPGGQNGLPGASINGSGQQLLSRLQPGFDLQKLLEFASLTSDEMRQRRMPEGLIATVEAQRPTLLRLQKDHENFRHRVGVANGVISTGPNQAQGLQQGQQGQPPQQPNMVPHAQGPGAMQPGMPGTNPAGILRPGQAHSPTPSMAGIPGMQGQMPTAMSGMVGMPSQPQPGQMPSGQQPMPGSQQLTRPPNAMGMHPGMLGASMMPQSQAVQNYLKAYPQELFVRLSNMINAKKAAFNNARNISTLPLHNITQEQRPEYDRLLERLWRQSSDLDKKLPIFLISVTDANKQEEILHKFIPVIASIEHQRQLLVSGLNKFFLSMDIMKNMIGQVHNWYSGVLGHISTAIATKNAEQQRLQQGMPGVGPQPGMTNAQGPNAVHMPPTNMQHHSPGAAPQSAMSLGSGVNTMANPMVPQHTSPQPPTMPAQSRAPIALQPPPNPGQKKQQQAKSTASGTPAPSAPSPAPSTSAPTPATVAATPTPVASASSPMAQTPQQTATPLKSPKQKPTPKPKPRQIKGKPAPSSPIKTSASTPTLTEASSSAPASSTAAYTASPEVNHGRTPSTIKRQREDEDAASHSLLTAPTVDSAPSPKRIKTEWASTPDAMVEASLSNHEARAEVIKTDEDATAFFAQMQSLLTQAENGEDQTSLPDISASISQILKVVGGDSQAQVDAFGFGTLDDIGNSGSNGVAGGSANGLGPNPQDDFNAFFDFASFPESDPIGAATPDLVPSSSTNPSPESGAADTPKLAVTKVNGDSKHASSATAVTSAAAQSGSGLGIETPDDLLRLGAWGEIDGGEAAYFHNVDGWQWQGPMPTADWAVMQP